MRILSCFVAAALLGLAPRADAGSPLSTKLSPTKLSPTKLSMTKPATLDFARVFGSPSLAGPVPRMVRLSPDGRWLTLLRPRADNRERYDLWGYDRRSGQWRMLVDSSALGSRDALSEAERMRRERLRIGDLQGVVSYAWGPDGRTLLVPLDDEVYLVGLDGVGVGVGVGGVGVEGVGVAGRAQRVEAAKGALAPALSGAGRYVSFLRDRRVWVAPVAGGAAQAITPEEASDTVHWGEAEFVAQEEMNRQDGLWWAPDDSRLAVERFDEARVGVVTRAAIGAAGTTTFAQRYPAAGTPNVEVSLWIMKPDGSGRVRVDLGTEAFSEKVGTGVSPENATKQGTDDIYLARVDWAPDGKALYVQREDRGQSRLDMLRVDPATGASSVIFSEHAAPGGWIDLSDAYRFLKDGSLIWWSQRDGFGHLWLLRDGHWRQLTRGAWVVTDLVGVDEARHRLVFAATRDDPLASQIYRLDYADPKAEPARLTDPGFVNAAAMDKTGHTLLVTRSSTMQPPQTYIADEDGRRLAWVEENRLDAAHPYAPWLARHREARFGTIEAADGTVLHWKMILPEMKPGRRYPVFFYHYGGPHLQVVTRGWGGALEQAIVAKGFIWFAIDNRGSANRGTAFETAISRAMGTHEVEDQKAGALYLKSLAFVDPGKIAVYGWSYGGYMTLKMLEADPGLYAAGIAGAPVTKWELYDTHYTERYLGMPQEPGGVYARADAIDGVARITDPLLLVHGLADDNVVFEHSSLAIARMQEAEVPFEMMLYPGQTHAVGGPMIGVHLWNTIFAFLARHGVTPVPGKD